METFCALIRGDLAPVGNKISLHRDPDELSFSLPGYSAFWVDSGTSALALAIADAKQKAPHVKNPQIIIPGYCCPDLVAAAVYAGVRPLVVDIGESDAGYDLTALERAINEHTLAIIAVNFLGIKERLTDIRALIANTDVKLIEDNAQWFPASKQDMDFTSDYLVFTFGRGKPLSLLGGGVLFSRGDISVSHLIQAEPTQNWTLYGKLVAYNLLLQPHRYCYLNRAPFLQLGETRYHPLTTITQMDAYRKSLFAANYLRYQTRSRAVEQAYDITCEKNGTQQLKSIHSARRNRLLRYPLLCRDGTARDSLLRKLNSAGLGASPMYQQAVVAIPEVNALVDVFGNLQHARRFASCFLTLPTHEYVSDKHIQRMSEILSDKT